MPKYVIKEGIVTKFLTTVYDALVKGKVKRLHVQDKELQQLIARASKVNDDMIKYFEKRRAEDPQLSRTMDILSDK